jgi:hypothetical protein
LKSFWDQPDWKPSALKEMIKRDYNVKMTLLSCRHAKKMVLDLLSGKHNEQYKHTREYANVILKWNPSNLDFIQRDGVFFQKMYVLLVSCKRGFLDGCRPMICVDACFLKGLHGAQLHIAIVRDANDNIDVVF